MTPDEANERMQRVHLSGIVSAAKSMAHSAENLEFYARQLASTPYFETRAQEEIENAEKALAAALMVVRIAMESYDDKPVDLPAFSEAAE